MKHTDIPIGSDAKHLRSWLEISPVCTKIVDLDFNLLYMSSAGIRLLKILDINEYYGKPYPFDFYPDSFKTEMVSNLKKARETKQIIVQEASVIDVEGNDLWFESTIVPVNDKNNELDYILIISLETTERRRAENNLRNSEGRFKAAFESAADCILIWDKEYNYLYANQSAIDHVGTTPDKVIGKNIRDGLGHIPDFMNLWMKRIDQVFESGEALEVIDATMMQGELIHTSSILSPVLDDQNEVTAVCVVYRDITQIKRTEDALLDSEKKLRNIFDNSTNLFYSHTTDHVLTYLSPQVEEMLGYTVEEAMINWTELASDNPINDIGFMNTVTAITTGERQPPYELELVKKCGEKIWVEIREFPLVENGKTTAIQGSLTEITERKKAEDDLRKSEAKFRFLSENMSDIVWTVDMNFRTTYVSPSVENILGFTQEERLAQSPEEMMTPQSLKAMKKLFKKEFIQEKFRKADPMRSIVILTEYYKKGGGTLWLENHARWVRNEKGKIIGIHGISRDITERRQAEEKLRRSEEKFRSIFENKGTATGIFGDDRIITDCNTVFSEMCGYSKTEIIGKMQWSDFVVQEDMVWMQKYHEERSKKGLSPPSQYECRVNHGDGTVHCMIVNIAVVGKMRIVSLIDVTDRKKAEEEVLRMQRLEGLGTIAGGIAHDFNNLLTGIFTNIEMARIELPKKSPSNSYLQDAYDAIHSARQLTGQLLTFAKGSAPMLDTVDTAVFLADSVNFNLRGSNIITKINLQEGLWSINADKGQFGQVLANLLINAKQSMPGGGTLHVDGRNICAGDPVDSPDPLTEFVCITIRDEGIGIPPKILKRIFDPYFSTKDTGHGLGLAIVLSIVEQHNGHISVASEPNIGTTFTIFLPAITVSETEGLLKTSRTDAASKEALSLHILLMDDEEMLRNVGEQLIIRLGYTIETAADGDETLQKYTAARESGKPFDLVIMDLTIRGGKGGQETIKELLDIAPEARVIVSSGYASGPIMADFAAYGFSGKLAKPFMMKDLEQEIIRVMKKD